MFEVVSVVWFKVALIVQPVLPSSRLAQTIERHRTEFRITNLHIYEQVATLSHTVPQVQSLCVDNRATERTSLVQATYPGGAPATVAAIPQPPNGTTAPTLSSDLADGTQLTALVKDRALTSLIQQVLDALKKATVESEKVRKYLPEFFDKLHEDLVKELRGRGEIKAANQAVHYIKYQLRLNHRREVAACLLPTERSLRHQSRCRSRVNPRNIIPVRHLDGRGKRDQYDAANSFMLSLKSLAILVMACYHSGVRLPPYHP